MEFFQLGIGTNTWLRLIVQLGDNLVLLPLDVFLELILGQLELVLGLKRNHHTTEVLADKVLDELGTGVTVREATFFEDFIGKISTCFEGQLFREDKSVVAVEEDFSDLQRVSSIAGTVKRLDEMGLRTLGMMTEGTACGVLGKMRRVEGVVRVISAVSVVGEVSVISRSVDEQKGEECKFLGE